MTFDEETAELVHLLEGVLLADVGWIRTVAGLPLYVELEEAMEPLQRFFSQEVPLQLLDSEEADTLRSADLRPETLRVGTGTIYPRDVTVEFYQEDEGIEKLLASFQLYGNLVTINGKDYLSDPPLVDEFLVVFSGVVQTPGWASGARRAPNLWEKVALLSQEPDLSEGEIRLLKNRLVPRRADEVEDLRIFLHEGRLSLTAYRLGQHEMVNFRMLGFEQYKERDFEQPVQYVVREADRYEIYSSRNFNHYIVVWSNCAQVQQIVVAVDEQSFEISGSEFAVIRRPQGRPANVQPIEHLEFTALDEDGVVIWQDAW